MVRHKPKSPQKPSRPMGGDRSRLLSYIQKRKGNPVIISRIKSKKKRKAGSHGIDNNNDTAPKRVVPRAVPGTTVVIAPMPQGAWNGRTVHGAWLRERDRNPDETQGGTGPTSRTEDPPCSLRAGEGTSSLPWSFKHRHKLVGCHTILSTLKNSLSRRSTLRHSKPVAVLLRGPAGSGKSLLVEHATRSLGLSASVFGVGDISTKRGFNEFAAAVKCTGFNKAAVIIDGIDHVGNFADVLGLLGKLHGNPRGRANTDPSAGNPVVFISDSGYSIRHRQLGPYCKQIDVPVPSKQNMTAILREIAKQEKAPHILRHAEKFIECSHGNISTMINQAEFYRNGKPSQADAPVKGEYMPALVERLRWPPTGDMCTSLFEHAFGTQNKHELLRYIMSNIADNRTTISHVNMVYDDISLSDCVPTQYQADIIRGSMALLPQGKRSRVRYRKPPKAKDRGILVQGALENRMSVGNLLDTMSHIDPVRFQVFDNAAHMPEPHCVKHLQVMNHKVRSYVTF